MFFFEIRKNQEAQSVNLLAYPEHADVEAKKLTSMFPDLKVQLIYLKQVKAIYKKGKRVKTFDFSTFYRGLTEEQMQNTKIKDSTTGQWV